MGRPPRTVKIRTMTFRLDDNVAARIDALAGGYGRSVWMRDALLRELERQEREQGVAGRKARKRGPKAEESRSTS